MGVTKPYQFIWFRDTHATEPYFFIGIGACKIFSINRIGFSLLTTWVAKNVRIKACED